MSLDQRRIEVKSGSKVWHGLLGLSSQQQGVAQLQLGLGIAWVQLHRPFKVLERFFVFHLTLVGLTKSEIQFTIAGLKIQSGLILLFSIWVTLLCEVGVPHEQSKAVRLGIG